MSAIKSLCLLLVLSLGLVALSGCSHHKPWFRKAEPPPPVVTDEFGNPIPVRK
jgi:hypothetical protein